MEFEYSKQGPAGLIFNTGNKLIDLGMKVKVTGTNGPEGRGVVRGITYANGMQFLTIDWVTKEGYQLTSGQKVKFTHY